jgi:hypothetical protein
MTRQDPLLEKVQQDLAMHDRFSVHTDAQAILQRDSNLADPKLRNQQLKADSLALRESGMSEKDLKDLGFPSLDTHTSQVMNDIDSRKSQATRKEMPGVYLSDQERGVVAEMERAIAAGDADKQAQIAARFRAPADRDEYEKLAKVSAIDMKKNGIDISTSRGNDGDYGTHSDYVSMEIRKKTPDGSVAYSVSTTDVYDNGTDRVKKGQATYTQDRDERDRAAKEISVQL